VEAGRQSGTVTTARFALEQGRSVYAVPGHPLDPRAEGTNRLIQNGATMVISADDVLNDLRPQLAPTSTPLADGRWRCSRPAQPPPMADDVSDTDRASVVAALDPQPVHVDDLPRATDLAVPALQVALIELDLAGRLEHHGAQLV
jgi:DNA processing protein